MIELDPRDRPLYRDERRVPIFTIILVILLVFAAGAGYWFFLSQKQKYNEVYNQLGIDPLPITLELKEEFRDRLQQLSREPCYKQAIMRLSDALRDAGYPRESAKSLLSFGKRCGGLSDEMLERVYAAFLEVNDFPAALKVADELTASDPANPHFRFWRAEIYAQTKEFERALTDYINVVQLLGAPERVGGSQFYNISLMYAALQRYCDAITPLETFISFDPASRRTAQITKVIADYAEKGKCDTRYASGFERLPLLGANGVRMLPVTINGVVGNFIFDTGATYVAVKSDFADKAKIKVESGTELPISVVGGLTTANLGYATTMSVGKAEAQGVAVAIIRNPAEPFGGVDGLLGMSFLARFKVTLSQNGGELTAIPLR
jgi:tetratricopeptide (TPR) repeat protein